MRTLLGAPELAARAAVVGGLTDPLLVLWKLAKHLDGFTFLGAGMSRVALLGPDGVVYKAPHSQEFYAEAFAKEASVFWYMDHEGLPWTPDYCPYEEHRVIAMPRYGNVDLVVYEQSEAKRWAEEWLSDVRPDNFGQRADGSLVLLDGDQLARPIRVYSSNPLDFVTRGFSPRDGLDVSLLGGGRRTGRADGLGLLGW